MNREKYLKEINDMLAGLSLRIQLDNKIRFTDLNIAAEVFYKDFLNLLFEYNLKDINTESINFPAIDLGDETNSLAIQVTADNKSTKIKSAINKFIKNKLYTKYKSLKFYIITNKQKKYTTRFDTKGHFVFDAQKDILDNKDLIRIINQYDTSRIKEIRDFLEKEVGPQSARQKSSIANEVITIMGLIELLSQEGVAISDIKSEDPDPDGKIYKRFADYTDFLVGELKEYIPQYKSKKEEAERILGMDAAKTRKIGRYLQTISDSSLRKNQNNPNAALDELVKVFEEKLNLSGNRYDFGAIRYYLLDQIVQCNVFPNVLK